MSINLIWDGANYEYDWTNDAECIHKKTYKNENEYKDGFFTVIICHDCEEVLSKEKINGFYNEIGDFIEIKN